MNRRSERASRVRDAAFRANRHAANERQAQTTTEETETFTTTFTFTDGSTRTQEFQSEQEQQTAQEFFNEGRSRGAW